MPAPPKTNDDAVVGAALDLVARGGVDALTMPDVAQAVGVKTPSLYKRFESRDALLAAVERRALEMVADRLARVPKGRGPKEHARALATAFRAFAHEHPRLYPLVFTARADDATQAARTKAVATLLETLGHLAGTEHALHAARTLTAFLHGFITMELSSAFRLGGSPSDAFDYGLDLFFDRFTERLERQA
ncbi:MAG TPA: TetR/AcrR family transcriptional regulator [Candidatus Limnocylindria bacterium]|jgi:AcrR family transcriptional regulator|nr:TetR/AcrR family transcriptional regulator [Candidatus Limnocylindria bacterium]